MTTPADWYPDPEVPNQLRYWDGTSWTEHRAPAPTQVAPPAAETSPASYEVPASEQATSAVSLPQEPTPSAEPEHAEGSGAHRAADEGAEAVPPSSEEPSYEPAASPQYEAPSFTPPPLPSWDPPAAQSYPSPPAQSWDAPPSAQPYETTGQPYDAASFAPPPFTPGQPPPGSSDGPNKKLIIGILGGAAALILVLALAFVYVFVIRDDDTAVVASPSSTSKKTTTSSETSTTKSSTSETAAPQPSNVGPVTDGNLTFTVTDVEAAETVTSTISDAVGKTAQGTYAVVHLKVGNTGTEPVTFLATFQRLKGSGQTLSPDDEATIFAGGGYADIAPGSEVDTVVVFDVPDDVEPTSMFFQQDPTTPGVELTF